MGNKEELNAQKKFAVKRHVVETYIYVSIRISPLFTSVQSNLLTMT